ncbi:hypothetical protein [Providencia rettgeri]|uniref:hypothetical protein n=1 Tax=Providencia TaxID=586 RepID=UPI0018C694E0|nr:hypothetical protein [Providencia rettgeri]ELR5222800.1 hypothetical protein [Providencia rettgeri]MBG5925830.1 hypothetical protein [Providencia rettgeri]MDX7322861.1 hypothetical protein [Providencia rettgeri]HEC8329933.1 hypothetical protein [Providencia rettgeri]
MKYKKSKGLFFLFLTSMWVIAIFVLGIFAFLFAESYAWLFMNTELMFSFEYVKKAGNLALMLGPMLGVITYFMYNK